MDNKYKNGKIYTIRYKNDDSLIYVGSTVQPLYKRFAVHKSLSKEPEIENRLLYSKMKETDMKDWYIELYEDYSCERKEQLTQREGQVIREIGTLNKLIAGRTKQEYREDNKEKINEKQKEYYEANKEKRKEYDQKNKEKIKKQHKEWEEANKEQRKTQKKEYYQDNKEHISELVFCECGCSVRRDKIARHKRTLKHERIMKELTKTSMSLNVGQNL